MEDNKRLDDRDNSGQKNHNLDPNKYRHHFQVKYTPKGLFQLFNKNETYIYEKKFSCDLPKNIIPPKSFHYPYSLENYCQADLLTMDFDLKKNPEILTDPKINTFIHQDFINNSLELIFPNLTTISKKRTDKEQDFKKKIIEIIERNDDINQDNNQFLSEIPDFLRRQTYLRPSTVISNEKKPKTKSEKSKPEKKQKMTKDELIRCIEQSFNDIDKIKIGMKHPDFRKKGVTAKNVYELSPMDNMPNIKFIEYLFPSEPSEVPNLDEKYLKPNHFLITNNKPDNINEDNTCSLYINNKLKTQEAHIEKDASEYYTYEKEFASSKMSQIDLFNRYFLILDKNQKKLKISALSNKFSFRRYKKITEENIKDRDQKEDGSENNKKENNTLKKKRKRDIILEPDNMKKEELEAKKRWFKDRGYIADFKERKINEVSHADVMEIEEERQKEEELKKQKSKEIGDFIDEGEGEDENEDNIFEDFDNDDNDEKKSNKDENDENDEDKSNQEDNDEEKNSNVEKKDKNEDSYDLNDEDNEDNKSKEEDEDNNDYYKNEKEDDNKEQEEDKFFD